jgi:hypothetical protein
VHYWARSFRVLNGQSTIDMECCCTSACSTIIITSNNCDGNISEHLLEVAKTTATSTTAAAAPTATTSSYPSKIGSAAKQLELNSLGLKRGGKISGIDLKPLPSQFSSYWNTIYQKWVLLKTAITNNILSKPNERNLYTNRDL